MRIHTMIATAALALCVSASMASAETITAVHNGGTVGAAQHEAFFVPFAEARGHTVVEDTFNQELAKLRSQIETGNLIWDVVSVTAINEATACEEGLLERVDWAAILDLEDFKGAGGFGECGVPNNLVSGGLVYDADVIDPADAPRTWADFWNVEKWPGKRGMLYRAEQTLEVALMADGVPPQDVMTVLSSDGGVERAFAKLEELKPHIMWWKSGDESMQNILSGEVVMTFAWNGRVATANKSNDRNLKIVFDAGHVSGSQYFAIMKGAPKLDLAKELILFSSSPKAQAQYSRLIDYAPANAEAFDLLTEAELATLPRDHLDKASFQNGQLYLNFWLDNGDTLLQRFLRFAAQ
ncbi:extracellular solute-binding protein [Nitratireductor sp. CAU 1489]|uniref:Extracellular solute-binding protein n=1 Tax=Nitratireductor arenosus TaxID=2682096 RepID=A0A844Q9J1_9HYPH|nr:ABC transporter substrate-binding protein [Nitratireductor arenosus]MVA95792.1 extracellular solute-binding protein [Nitratireductor arenosus]